MSGYLVWKFRAGDAVKHGPTGETWTLACDQDGHRVVACGWPETMAEAADCTLVRAATDEQRLEILRAVGKPGEESYRRSLARHQLKQE